MPLQQRVQLTLSWINVMTPPRLQSHLCPTPQRTALHQAGCPDNKLSKTRDPSACKPDCTEPMLDRPAISSPLSCPNTPLPCCVIQCCQTTSHTWNDIKSNNTLGLSSLHTSTGTR